MQLLDFPDLDQANRIATSHIELIDKVIDDILDKGIYSPPEPFMNLNLGLERVQMAYNLAKIQEAPDKSLRYLRQWMTQAAELMGLLDQPEPPMAMGPGMPPEGLPPLGPEGAMPPDIGLGGPPEAGLPGGESLPVGLPPGLPPGPPPMGPPAGPPMGPPMGPPAI